MKLTSLALISLGLASGAMAQTVQASAPAPAAATSAPMRIDQTVYTQRLPSAAELTSSAAAQGRTVDRIEQSGAQMTATYRSANGEVTTVLYALLPNGAGASGQQVATPTTPAPQIVGSAPAPTVVYTEEPRVVYYSDGPYYGYPRYYYPPVSIGLGFGFRGGYGYHGGGFYRGGFGFHHR